MKKLLLQILVTILGGILVAIPTFLVMVHIGGNYGCWVYINLLFNSRGYESCGMFGAVIGLIIGGVLGLILSDRIINKK